jgi:hypothetical protein
MNMSVADSSRAKVLKRSHGTMYCPSALIDKEHVMSRIQVPLCIASTTSLRYHTLLLTAVQTSRKACWMEEPSSQRSHQNKARAPLSTWTHDRNIKHGMHCTLGLERQGCPETIRVCPREPERVTIVMRSNTPVHRALKGRVTFCQTT